MPPAAVGELVREHIAPRPFKVGPVFIEIADLRHRNALEFAFLAQHIEQYGRRRARFGVAVEIDDIIEIARPCPFGERAHFFAKGLFISVGKHFDTAVRCVTVGMKDRHPDRREDKPFVCGQIKFDAWQTA